MDRTLQKLLDKFISTQQSKKNQAVEQSVPIQNRNVSKTPLLKKNKQFSSFKIHDEVSKEIIENPETKTATGTVQIQSNSGQTLKHFALVGHSQPQLRLPLSKEFKKIRMNHMTD